MESTACNSNFARHRPYSLDHALPRITKVCCTRAPRRVELVLTKHRWLIDQGKTEKAHQVLAKLHAHGDMNDPFVLAEFEQIQESITYEHEHEAKSYMELFRSKTAFRRLLIACALQASIQITGVSAIQYYSVTIYGQIGISGNNTLKYQGINSIIALIAQFCTILFIDKTGRRWPLILGNLGNMVTFIIATILLAMFPPGVSTNIGAQWGFIIMTWLCEYLSDFRADNG